MQFFDKANQWYWEAEQAARAVHDLDAMAYCLPSHVCFTNKLTLQSCSRQAPQLQVSEPAPCASHLLTAWPYVTCSSFHAIDSLSMNYVAELCSWQCQWWSPLGANLCKEWDGRPGEAVEHLHPGPPLLSNVVAVHDVQDLISNGLSIATPAHAAQHVANPLLCGATCPPMRLHTHQPQV